MSRIVSGRPRSSALLVYTVLSVVASGLLFTLPTHGQEAGWDEVTHDLTKLAADVPGEEVGNFGRSVALDGDAAVIGADSSEEQGAAFIFRRDAKTDEWEQEQRITASDGEDGDLFGFFVAIDGDIVVVSAPLKDEGVAYIFEFDGDSWEETQKVSAEGGVSVAVNGDVIVVGDQTDGDLGFVAGAARVYRLDGGEWVEEQKLTASDGGTFERFGFTVDLTDDLIVVGAFGARDGENQTGAAYVFEFDGQEWEEISKLTADNGGDLDAVGVSVAIDGDGELIVLGAYLDDAQGIDAGAAYVFRYDADEDDWLEEMQLLPSDGGQEDRFGFVVDVDRSVILAGAHLDDDEGTNAGAAYVYRYNGETWIESAKFTASDGEADDNLGFTLSMDEDLALIGAFNDDDFGDNVGAAYLFDASVPLFLRGDADGDGDVDSLKDSFFLLNWGFQLDAPAPPCLDAADVNGDNRDFALVDGLFLLRWAFIEGEVPPAPGPVDCGPDPDQDVALDCETPPDFCREGGG